MSDATGDLITRVYSNFRGVDFRGEEINLARSPDSLNVWRNYKKTASIETRPGMQLVTKPAWQMACRGIYFAEGALMVHCYTPDSEEGGQLCTIVFCDDGTAELDQLLCYNMSELPSDGFYFGDKLYILDGTRLIKVSNIDGADDVKGYIPTTTIGRKPSGGGTTYEDVNLLRGDRINTFLADGVSVDYYLDAQDISEEDLTDEWGETTVIVKVNGAQVDNFTFDREKGLITFNEAPPAPDTDGQDNVSIQFRKSIAGYRERITHCRLLQVFDNRVFVSGNPDYPNMVWHSALNDPTYFSDQDYYQEGLDEAPIRAIVAGNNALWAFRESSEANTNIYYHTPTLDSEYGKIYPSIHSSIALGCKGKAINFNDDIVFFSDRGMEGISGDVTTEQVAAHRSSLVDRKLAAEADYANMVLVEWEGYLCVFIGNKGYLADSRAVFTNEDHTEYEWFYWEMEHEITCAKVIDGVLYLGTPDGLYALTDTECDLESYWVTPKDKFKYPHMQKTSNKRGCVAEATGDITVYAKTEGTGFELIGTYENVQDYFVSRIKRKKFKDIQLKFYSPTRFTLESVTLECWIGGYIKR